MRYMVQLPFYINILLSGLTELDLNDILQKEILVNN